MNELLIEARRIFYLYLEEQPIDRASFLDEACSGDADLRARVEALLRSHDAEDTFLQEPIANPADLLREVAGGSRQTDHPGSPGRVTPAGAAQLQGGQGSPRSVPDEIGFIPRRIGPYEILGTLGQGGMGVVYQARHTELNRVVALKMARASVATESGEYLRFRSEAEAVAGLDHPNVVKIFEVGSQDGVPYFTLEYCPAGSLEKLCRKGPMAPREVASAMRQIALGVAAAHSQGIVHRDLKPANVLMAGGEDVSPTATLKVTDFGLARKTDGAALTATGLIVGTPAYMPPEQAIGSKRFSPAMDVWALGVMLYEMLVGKLPFEGESPLHIMRKVVDCEPALPRSVNPKVPRDLEVICLKCLAKDPARRYLSADSLADDLNRWLHGIPIQARPAGQLELAWKWVQRNPAAALTAGAMGAAIVASTFFAVLAERARAAEAEQRRIAQETAEREAKERELKETALAAEEKQRLLAERNEKRADRARKASEAFGHFLEEDILATARPRGVQNGLGYDVTVREALEHAESQIPTRFPNEPLAEARARHGIGVTWRNLWELHRAEKNLRKAVELRSRYFGDSDLETLDSRNSLAVTLLQAGRGREAILLSEENLRRIESITGAGHPETIDFMNTLAGAYEATERLPEAIDLFQKIASLAETYHGENSERTLRARQNLASAYESADRLKEAVDMFERTLRAQEKTLGVDHPDTISTRHKLAHAYWKTGRLDKSVPLLEAVLEQSKKVLGMDHPETLAAQANLGANYKDVGRLDEAIPLLEDVVRRMERAPNYVQEAVAWAKPLLAEAYDLAGQYTKSEPYHRADFESTLQQYGPADVRTGTAAGRLGSCLFQQQKHVEAEGPLRRCVEIRRRMDPDSWVTADLESSLGVALAVQGKIREAEPLLVGAFQKMKRAHAAGQLDPGATEDLPEQTRLLLLRKALSQVIRFCDLLGRTEEAARWRAELRELGETP